MEGTQLDHLYQNTWAYGKATSKSTCVGLNFAPPSPLVSMLAVPAHLPIMDNYRVLVDNLVECQCKLDHLVRFRAFATTTLHMELWAPFLKSILRENLNKSESLDPLC